MTVLATGVPRSRLIDTTAPLQGGGNLGANRTISLVDEAVELIYGSMKYFNVVRYGADPTGADDSSSAFTDAVNDAVDAGGGVVLIPAGEFIVENVPVHEKVFFEGVGACSSVLGASTSKLKLPASPSAGAAIFRLGFGDYESFESAGISRCELDGGQFSATAYFPTSPTTTVEMNKLRGIDMRYSTPISISSNDYANGVLTTSAPHNLTTGDTFVLVVGTSGVLPADSSPQPSYKYARVISPTEVAGYDTAAHAAAGGATGLQVYSDAGIFPYSIARCCTVLLRFSIRDCYIHHFDEGVRGSCTSDRSLTEYTWIRHNYVGVQGQEHPKFSYSDIRFNYLGITGRFADWMFGSTNNVNQNFYGISPYGTDKGSNAYKFNTGSTTYINNSTFGGAFFQNVVALTISENCTVLPGTLICGSASDSAPYTYTNAIGIRVQGQKNLISGTFGENGATTSFGKCAILLDKAGTAGAVNPDITIDGAMFLLSAGAAIQGGNSNETTPLFGTGSYGAFERLVVRNCSAALQGQRFIHLRSGNGFITYTTIANNDVRFLTGGTSPIGASDGIIEGAFYTGTDIVNNRIYAVSGTVGSAIEFGPNAAGNTRVLDNRFDGSYSAASLFSPTIPTGCVIRNNAGFTTEATGLVGMADGASTATVTHGLALTPEMRQTMVTLLGVTLGPTAFKVGTPTSTQFTITANTAVTGGATLGSASGTTLPITGHGLQTGDPIYWTGGTVAGTGTGAGVVTFVRRTDDNNVTLHLTQAAAIANSGAITLTGSGGTMGIVLAWRAGFNGW